MKMLLHYQDGDSNPNDLQPRQRQQGKEQKGQIQNFFQKESGNTPRPKETAPGFEIGPHHPHQNVSFRSDLLAAALN